jgi:3'-phosphoadenosine 5'-phosphosulfate sulfotransferase (PAPS reductase)/FAD synthetase
MKKNDVVCWWSGGITSAVACYLALELYGIERCKFIFIDTKNEHSDTYRFLKDCEKWYGKEIEVITSKDYDSIQDVWRKHKSLNVATGAICSTKLKRKVREDWQKENEYSFQVFGFEAEAKEFKRSRGMKLNHSKIKPIFPLLMFGYTKDECIKMVQNENIEIPLMYKLGFQNNNCFGTGCVQGGIGYWQKMKIDFPATFEKMALMEHELTDAKGQPVCISKDQSKNGGLVFLKKHKDYPNIKTIDEMKGFKVQPLKDCNGYCGVNDLNEPNETEKEINFDNGEAYQKKLF